MYNIDFLCIYPYYDPELLPYCQTKLDKDFMVEYVEAFSQDELSNCLYKANFLECFNITEYDEETIGKELDLLYKILAENNRFKKCMEIMANKYVSEDLSTGLAVLFSYDYFFLTHACICEYLKTNEIPTLEKLEKYIANKK